MEKKSIEALVEKKGGKLVAIASTETKDRMGDVIKAEGWDLKNFKKNPVIQFAHKYDQPPIGIAENIRVQDKKLIFEPVFHEITQLARDVKRMFEEGIMRAFSVGFIPKKFINEKGEEVEPKMRDNIIAEAELLEISAVPIPANAEALTLPKEYTEKESKEVCNWIKGKLKCSNQKSLENEADEISDAEMKPYPNEHTCVLTDVKKYDKFARKNCAVKHDGKCIDYIFGIKNGKSELHSMRYKIDVWTESAARAHCKEHKGIKFEPAAPKKTEEEIELKGVIPYKNTGKAPENEPWDAGAELKKATGDAKKLRTMHAWVDTSDDNFDPSERKWYKLPHHKGDGTQPAVWRGVAAAMGALFGARGGVDIPSSDRRGVYNHLAKHYKEFDKTPPEFREYTESELKSMSEAGDIYIEPTETEVQEKEGRVLSGKNRKQIEEAVSILKQAVSTLQKLLKATEPAKSGEGKLKKGRSEEAQEPLRNRVVVRALQKMSGDLSQILNQIKRTKKNGKKTSS